MLLVYIRWLFSGDDFTLSLDKKGPNCLFTFLVLHSGRSPIRLHLSNSGSIRKLKPTSLEEFCHFFPVLLRSSKAFKIVTRPVLLLRHIWFVTFQRYISHWEELPQSVSDFIFSKHYGCTPRGVRGVKRSEIL